MILEILLNPITLIVALVVSVMIVRDLLTRGSHLFAVQDCVYRHVTMMSKDDIDGAWDSLGFDLKSSLTRPQREKKGKGFVGTGRLKTYAKENRDVYHEGRLTIDSVNQVMKVKPPKEMYMVRLRSQSSGYVRMTVWVSRVPLRADGWSVEEVCIHPPNGNVNAGETLTGAKLSGGSSSRFAKEAKRRARARSDRSAKSA